MSKPIQSMSTWAGLALAAALALSACERRDDTRTAGEKLDGAISSAEQRADAARVEANRQTGEAKEALKDATQDVKDASKQAANAVTDAAGDAAITTSVNAELARDPTLSAMQINVDTQSGRVALKGTAPDAAARDRATRLAAGVRGVNSVDNQLTVRSNG
jgi:osmotically-inducible protein OsmY